MKPSHSTGGVRPPRLCARAGVNGAFLRLRLVSSAIIHRGESLKRAANAEGMSKSGMIRNIVKRYLRERSEKVQESP